MIESTKITFRHQLIDRLDDITDLTALLFPGNRNQQYAAARILLELKSANGVLATMSHLEDRYQISRRTLQRARLSPQRPHRSTASTSRMTTLRTPAGSRAQAAMSRWRS